MSSVPVRDGFKFAFPAQRKHPHIIFEARTKVKQTCANTGLEWGRGGRAGKGPKLKAERIKRDVREVTKYVETALVLDKAMVMRSHDAPFPLRLTRSFLFPRQFEKRNGSRRIEVIQDAIQIANIADLVSK